MPPPGAVPKPVLQTVLDHLAGLFLSGAKGDPDAARLAADQMLAAYQVEDAEQLCLAAAVIGFSLHALETLAQAADPDLTLNRMLRLRGNAVSLSREAHKAQRRLNQLQRLGRPTRNAASASKCGEAMLGQAPCDAPPADDPPPGQVAVGATAGTKRAGHEVLQHEVLPHAGPADARPKNESCLRSAHKRDMTRRMTENILRNQARYAANVAAGETKAANRDPDASATAARAEPDLPEMGLSPVDVPDVDTQQNSGASRGYGAAPAGQPRATAA